MRIATVVDPWRTLWCVVHAARMFLRSTGYRRADKRARRGVLRCILRALRTGVLRGNENQTRAGLLRALAADVDARTRAMRLSAAVGAFVLVAGVLDPHDLAGQVLLAWFGWFARDALAERAARARAVALREWAARTIVVGSDADAPEGE